MNTTSENPETRPSPLRQMRLDLGYPVAAEFCRILEISPSALANAETRSRETGTISPLYLERIRRKFPKMDQAISKWTPENRTFHRADVDSAREEAKQLELDDQENLTVGPVDPAARVWAFEYRTAALLDRLAHQIEANGKTVSRLPAGLQVEDSPRRASNDHAERFGDLLYPRSSEFDLRSGTVCLLGSPDRHSLATPVLEVLRGSVGLDVEIEIDTRGSYPSQFGVPTHLKSLRIQWEGREDIYHPQVFSQDGDVLYRDFGVIVFYPLVGPKPEQDRGQDVFRTNKFDPKWLISVMGVHRLATGIGVRLLENEELRENDPELKGKRFLPFDGHKGFVAFEVVLRHRDRRSHIESLRLLAAHSELDEEAR